MTKLPRGIRNNNPGNIRNSHLTDWQGEVPLHGKNDGAFEEFETMAYGIRAMMKLLQNYQKKYGLKSIAALIERYAPHNENNTSGYIRRISAEMQIPHNAPIDLDDKATMCALVDAMCLVENGQRVSPEDIEFGWELL